MKEEVLVNGYQIIDESLFVQYSSHDHIRQVNQFEAKLLNTKYGIEIFQCSIKKGGCEFKAYLANLGYGHDEIINKILLKLFKARFSVFKEIDPKFGTGE